MDRRRFLGTSLAAMVGGALARPARAASTSGRKFVFVGAQGGWDPTRVFLPVFDFSGVDVEAGANTTSVGDLTWVTHSNRPSVDAFFSNYAAQSLVLNGVLVPSIAHDICRMLVLTGSVSGLDPDWPAIIGSAEGSRILPHIVIGGPSFPGDRGTAVARTGGFGQLEGLLDGSALALSDQPVSAPISPAESLMDRWTARRYAAWAESGRTASGRALGADLVASLERARAVKDLRWIVDFTGGSDFESQAAVAVDALSRGVARCVSLDSTGSLLAWDTHAENDAIQSYLFEDLFHGLGLLVGMLAGAPGETTPTLLEETVVVVFSEMGRTPQLNSAEGKDHWPYTSVLLVGAGIQGGRVVGGLDSNYYGLALDPVTGDADEDGNVPGVTDLGATLLTLADVDPAELLPDGQVIGGVIA